MTAHAYRFRFSKRGRMRFLSHLDVQRLLVRAIRRADLPVKFSEGFTPRPRLSFPLALAVGIESLDEIAELDLIDPIDAEELRGRLNAQLPEGIRIEAAEALPPGARTEVDSVDYLVKIPSDENVVRQAEALMARPTVEVERDRGEGSRTVDIRPYLRAIRVDAEGFQLTLAVTPQGSARPSEVLEALGLDPFIPVLKLRTHLKDASREDAHAG